MLVGRERELAAARAALARLGLSSADGGGAGLLLVGEAGVGKSHVLAALAEEARAAGADVRLGRCFADIARASFAPFAEALGEEALATTKRPSLGPVEDRARAFESVLSAVARRAAERPLVLAVDDLHWADPESVRLFLHLARFGLGGAVLLVGTVRAPDLDGAKNPVLDEALAELARDRRFESLTLRPFTAAETSTYATEVVGADVPQAVVRTLHAETGGNPLYVRELVRHLFEEGKLRVESGQVSTDFAAAELGLPPTIRHVVRQRLARLSTPSTAIVRCACVAGAPIALDALANATDATEETALDAIDEALAAGMLRATEAGYEATHAIVRRAVVEELNPHRRARLHRRIAEALSKAHGTDPAAIAMHYHASRALPGADGGVRFALLAAEVARAAGGHEAAVVLLDAAAELAASAPLEIVADVASRRARGLAEALQPHAAIAAVDVAIEALARANRSADVPSLLADVAEALEVGGVARTMVQPLVKRALTLASERHDATWARLVRLARPLTPVLDGPVYVSIFGSIDLEARAVLRAGSEHDFAMTVDLHDQEGGTDTDDLVARASTWTDEVAAIRVLDACARNVFFWRTDMRLAQHLMSDVLARSERVGSMTGQVSAHVLLGCTRAPLGDLAGARAAHARASELSSRLGSMHRMKVVGPLALETILAYFERRPCPETAAKLVGFASSPEAAATPFGIVALGLGVLASALSGDEATTRRLLPHHIDVLQNLPPALNEWCASRDCAATASWWIGDATHAHAILALEDRRIAPSGGACWSARNATQARMKALIGELDEAAALFEAARVGLRADGRAACIPIVDHDEALAHVRAGTNDHARISALVASAARGFEAFGLGEWKRATLALERKPASEGLSAREVEVLRLLAEGLANKEIGAKLFISVPTVERHVANVYAKIGVSGRAAATAWAIKRGIART